jgi:class 3 adenylate cyclase
MTADLACAACGKALRSSAKFCDACGSPVATPAEYKQVTVLFAHVVGSMDIAAAVGAERLREILTELIKRSTAVVARYGGTLDKFTGDGVMAVFGAPAALEDHALRGCFAALGIQDEAKLLAAEVGQHDGIELNLRMGLNSGQVVAGGIGSAATAYTAVGAEVGMAHRLGSTARPDTVLLSASTAGLVEDVASLGDPELVPIKGSNHPVVVRRLLGVDAKRPRTASSKSTLVGRKPELASLATMLDRAVAGRGSVVGVVGPAGIGKSRLADEVVQLARSRRIDVFTTFCESHAADVPYGAVARFLQAVWRVSGLDDESARARMRNVFAHADPEDMLFLDDLLGIADPDVPLPKISPHARRRRLTKLVTAARLACDQPTLILVEDAHWIDGASESMVADFLAMTPRNRWLVLITYRPEYHGPLRHVAAAKTISLAPLSETETATLVGGLLGSDPSVNEIGEIIAAHAAGNPFFAQEITRELAERRVLAGRRGAHVCVERAAEVRVPATLQTTIAARIDRLGVAAKRTLTAAAVIGHSFDSDLLSRLGIDSSLRELVTAELVDQVACNGKTTYAFRHPLIHTVAYESQLKSERARIHRQLAIAIESSESHSAEPKAALIAEHLAAAGDLRAALGWHMRAAAWATNRDITTAVRSWERAQELADALPADAPDRTALRIAPRTMLCGIAARIPMNVAGQRFDELRELCAASRNYGALVIAMAGLVAEHAVRKRLLQAARVASETMALCESIAEPTLTVGLSAPLLYAKIENAEWHDVLAWSQRAIELADDDPRMGDFIVGSPLAIALASRAVARWRVGQPGWRTDLRRGLQMARGTDPESYAMVISAYVGSIPNGVLRSDNSLIDEIEDAVRTAERSGNDPALAIARATLGLALIHSESAATRTRGERLLTKLFVRKGNRLSSSPIVELYLGRERARRGEHDEAMPPMRAAVDRLFRHGRLSAWGPAATATLVETLLERGAEHDVVEAEAVTDRFAAIPTDGSYVRDIWLLRLRALIARARDDQASYLTFVDDYREMAECLEYDGHIEWAAAMGA